MRRLALPLIIVFATLLAVSPSAFAQNPVQIQVTPDTAPLNLVIAQVQKALDDYQENRGGGADALPPLTSAVFDFKATSVVTIGGVINFFIFKFGVSHESAVTNDVTYTYSFPKPRREAGLLATRKAPELKDTLARTIQSAAAAVKTAGTLGELSLTKVAVSIQYGVKWEGSGGGSVPVFTFITVGLSGAEAKDTVQSVSLTFGQ
jgi:hypothetical protein